MSKKILILLLTLIVLSGCTNNKQAVDIDGQKYRNSLEYIASIKDNDKLLGSACLVLFTDNNDFITILTASHVVKEYIDKASTLELTIGNLAFQIDKIIIPNILTDLAVLKSNDLTNYVINKDNNKKIPRLIVTSKNLKFDPVYIIHNSQYNSISEPILSKGHILQLNNEEILTYAPLVNSGGSGSPIFTENTGEIVGLITGIKINTKQKNSTGIAYGISSPEIIKVLQEAALSELKIFSEKLPQP